MEKIADKYNIMIIGDEKVGKTTVLERYFNRKFMSERKKTIGLEFYCSDYIDSKTKLQYKLKFWDTAGQEKFRSVTKNYYQRAHGMMITMAVDNRPSFDNLKMWVNNVFENATNKNMPLVIICNKCDLEEDKKVVKEHEVTNLCKEEINLRVFFTSAKNGTNIDEVFNYITEEVVKVNSFDNNRFSLIQNSDPEGSRSRGCC